MTNKHRDRPGRRQRTLVFGSEALSKTVGGDRELSALVKAAPQLDARITTSAFATIEAWDPLKRSHAALWTWTLSRISIVHTDDQQLTTARGLLRSAGLHGHKHAIDAMLAAVAVGSSNRGEQVTLFTSDVADLRKLLADNAVKVERI